MAELGQTTSATVSSDTWKAVSGGDVDGAAFRAYITKFVAMMKRKAAALAREIDRGVLSV